MGPDWRCQIFFLVEKRKSQGMSETPNIVVCGICTLLFYCVSQKMLLTIGKCGAPIVE